MITIEETGNLFNIAVFGEFTLADYQEFEEKVLYRSGLNGPVNVLFDWRDMLSYTVDVAWEDIKFIHKYGGEFRRIAIITEDQWQAWAAWVANLFVDADVRVFGNYDDAKAWAEA